MKKNQNNDGSVYTLRDWKKVNTKSGSVFMHPVAREVASWMKKKPIKKKAFDNTSLDSRSVTTLKDWRKGKQMTVQTNFNIENAYDRMYTTVNFYHPIVAEVAGFFRKVDRAQKSGITAVLALQKKLS